MYDVHTNEELIDFHNKHDPLFARLLRETEGEKDENKFQIGIALMSLVLSGKVKIIQSPQGELLFEHQLPN